MKIVIPQEKLKQGLTLTERICGKSVTFPILSHVKLKAIKNFLNLTATDLEIGVNWWTLGKVNLEGEVVVPSRSLTNLVSFLPNKPVLLEKRNSSLYLECEKIKSFIKSAASEDFPLIPKISEGEIFSISIPLFCQSLNQVVDVASPSTTRPEISGVFFVFQKDIVKMVATDSFRLGEKTVFFEKPASLEKTYSLILPQKAAREIINIFGDKEGDLKIYFSPNQILFESIMPETPHPEIQLTSRLIEGEFPNYQEIIPKKYETQVVIQRADFLNQIKTASIFSGKINEIKLKIKPEQELVEISSQNPDLGEYQGVLPAKIKGKELEISFNHKFLADGLLNIKSQEVIFELTNTGGPGVLKPVGDPSYLYIVMPIKTS